MKHDWNTPPSARSRSPVVEPPGKRAANEVPPHIPARIPGEQIQQPFRDFRRRRLDRRIRISRSRTNPETASPLGRAHGFAEVGDGHFDGGCGRTPLARQAAASSGSLESSCRYGEVRHHRPCPVHPPQSIRSSRSVVPAERKISSSTRG